MFERFTTRARRCMQLSKEEAQALGHNYIGTEHILLGLIREGHGVAASALTREAVLLDDVREAVVGIIGRSQPATSGVIPFTPRVKKTLELALRESLQLGHSYIGTEHLLLGLLREGEGIGAEVLNRFTTISDVRRAVVSILTERKANTEPCPICGMPYHRYSPNDPEHEFNAMGCVNELRPEVVRLKKALYEIVGESAYWATRIAREALGMNSDGSWPTGAVS